MNSYFSFDDGLAIATYDEKAFRKLCEYAKNLKEVTKIHEGFRVVNYKDAGPGISIALKTGGTILYFPSEKEMNGEKEMTEMSIDDAIYCMKSYLPDESSEFYNFICVKCKYYASSQDEKDGRVYYCRSAEAHKMAIKALEAQKQLENED